MRSLIPKDVNLALSPPVARWGARLIDACHEGLSLCGIRMLFQENFVSGQFVPETGVVLFRIGEIGAFVFLTSRQLRSQRRPRVRFPSRG